MTFLVTHEKEQEDAFELSQCSKAAVHCIELVDE
jgi:hypothetical protein